MAMAAVIHQGYQITFRDTTTLDKRITSRMSKAIQIKTKLLSFGDTESQKKSMRSCHESC